MAPSTPTGPTPLLPAALATDLAGDVYSPFGHNHLPSSHRSFRCGKLHDWLYLSALIVRGRMIEASPTEGELNDSVMYPIPRVSFPQAS